MIPKWGFAVGGFVLGLLAMGVGHAAIGRSTPAPAASARPEPDGKPASKDDLEAANARLVESLHECDKKLAEATHTPLPARSAEADPAPGDAGGPRRRRGGGEPTAEDWDRMAKSGVIRVRIPCVRDKPWSPGEGTLERLGLTAADGRTLKEAYERSNKRVTDQVKPLCAKALGSQEVADKLGTTACIDAITSSARRASPEAAQQSLVRAAEAQTGKQGGKPATDASALEQLTLALAREGSAFEADLARSLGPDEAKRLAWAPELCADRRVLRASDDDPEVDPSGPPRGRRGGRGAQ